MLPTPRLPARTSYRRVATSDTRRTPAFALGLLASLVLLTGGGAALAWWSESHPVITEAAFAALPEDMPGFFRKGKGTVASYSGDPDLWKEKTVPALRSAENPNHFINLEALLGKDLPKTRAEYVRLCWSVNTDADKIGCLPYAIQEEYEKLVMAFAEHRAAPGDKAIQAKILYLAGVLAHYAEDAAQPLHTTIHYDGRARPDKSSPRSGIHLKADALPEKLGLTAEEMAKGLKKAEAPKDGAFTVVLVAIKESHDRVDRLYELEPKLPDAGAEPPKEPDKELREFCLERCRAGASFTAALWYSAWVQSGKVELPEWRKSEIIKPSAPATGSGRSP
jgi:hypothetical protein